MSATTSDGRRGGRAALLAELTAVAVAAQFLTITPPLIRRLFRPEELGRAVGYFPLIGLGLGLALAGLHLLLELAFPPLVAAALVLVAWVGLSGGLHLDGFLDSCDGLFGGYTPEDRLRIMRDERVGAYAVAGGVLLLLLKLTALASSANTALALVLAPVLGRCAIAVTLVALPYARDRGLGRDMKDHARPVRALQAGAVAAIVAVATGGVIGVAALVVAAATAAALSRFFLGRIPGMTGDTYGATCEVVEVAVLLVLTAGWAP